MRQRRYNLLFFMVAAVFSTATISSCIKGETPTADVVGIFEEFGVEGEKGTATITPYTSSVEVDLLEAANPKSVKISKMAMPAGAVCYLMQSDGERREIGVGSVIDLSSPVKVRIKTFAEYEWTISAKKQNIERVFKLAGKQQAGDAIFELHSKSVFVYVPAGSDMASIMVDSIKLGPEKVTKMTPDLNDKLLWESQVAGSRVEVKVEYHGIVEMWSLYVDETKSGTNTVKRGDIWATFATVTATIIDESAEDVKFGYREKGGEEWLYADAEPTAAYGYSVRITGLKPVTEYEVCVSVGDEFVGNPVDFTTDTAAPLPNGRFEDWHQDSRKVWYANAATASKFWDSGNEGTVTAPLVGKESNNITTGESGGRPGSTGAKYAQLKSSWFGAVGVGAFAAGNIYTGNFIEARVSANPSGRVEFGRPWQGARPSAMNVWYKAVLGEVNYAKTGAPITKGEKDKFQIMIAFADSGFPYTIDTADWSTLVDYETDPRILAYGSLVGSEDVENWTEHRIDIEYRSLDRIPTHIIVVVSASMYGDYFAGSTSSVLCIDDFELIYDDNVVVKE